MNGIINVYKEKGYTSHDVVAKLRGILKTRKIGHTGTLDPDAEGVLPVCIGNATKLCGMFTGKDKTYRTVMRLGITTDTQDLTGNVQMRREVDGEIITDDKIIGVVNTFAGEYMQVPPMYSALRVNGKRLYELAREGVEVERTPRKVHIYSISVESVNLPEITMTVSCSKGTYIRTLCSDIGEKLGTGGCMAELLRTKSGGFKIEDSLKIDRIKEYADSGRIEDILIPTDKIFESYAECRVARKYNKLIYNGNKFSRENIVDCANVSGAERVRVYDEDDNFIGIYRYDAVQDLYIPVKMFLTGGNNGTGKKH